MATIAPGSTQGFNPLGFLVPAFQGLLQGQELGRESQDLQNLRIHQQALGQAPGANAQLPAFQSQRFKGFQAQNLFQNLGLANKQFSGPRVARANDGTGLRTGTVYQISPTGSVGVVQTPLVKTGGIEEFTAQGYDEETAQLAFDIKNGIKPRPSTIKAYNELDPVAQAKFLSSLEQTAKGPYFGIEGGNEKPLMPRLDTWIQGQKKLNPIFGGTPAGQQAIPTPGQPLALPGKLPRKIDNSKIPTKPISDEDLNKLSSEEIDAMLLDSGGAVGQEISSFVLSLPRHGKQIYNQMKGKRKERFVALVQVTDLTGWFQESDREKMNIFLDLVNKSNK